MSKLVNFLAFQTCWFACVLGAAAGVYWLGPAAVAAFAAVHLSRVAAPGRDLRLGLALLLLGVVLDSLWTAAGLLRFERSGPFLGLLPLWIGALWVNFALTLYHSLAWMRGRYLLGALLGAISGPLSYWAGVRLGALGFHPDVWPSLLVLAGSWAVALPVALLLAERCDRSRPLSGPVAGARLPEAAGP